MQVLSQILLCKGQVPFSFTNYAEQRVMYIPEHYTSVSNLTISDVNSNTTAKHNRRHRQHPNTTTSNQKVLGMEKYNDILNAHT